MNRDNRLWQPVPSAPIHWGEDGNPRSIEFGDVYYSSQNGLEESAHVFLAGNQLPERWLQHSRPSFCVAETGFGTGLNFLACWAAWHACHSANSIARLHYISIENRPLNRADLERALAHWPSLAPFSKQLLKQYPSLIPGEHRLVFEQGQVLLDLHFDDVAQVLPAMAEGVEPAIDAWFLDGFAPSKNPDMWQPTLFENIAQASRQQATIATFSCAGPVRRGLSASGFTMTKTPGYGRKREQLQGFLPQPAQTAKVGKTPWHLPQQSQPVAEHALVIGAGLAGCLTAAALASRGVEVTLLERNLIAGEGSGNRQGILYTRLSTHHSTLIDFSLQSFDFARRYYRQLLDQGTLQWGVDGSLCGSFNQLYKPTEQQTLAQVLQSVPELAQVVDANTASQLLGVEQNRAGYWFPQSGWIDPSALCRAVVQQSGISLQENCGDIHLKASEQGWRAIGTNGLDVHASHVVITCGTGSKQLEQLHWLPVQTIRGQVTQLPKQDSLETLKAVFCHDGYIAPAHKDGQCLGATFDLNDPGRDIRPEDHQRNLAALADALPSKREQLTNVDVSTLTGRVGFRCASPDYLPLVGQVPDYPAFLQCYGDLRKNARQVIAKRGVYMSGLFINTAHGSRGLTSAPLAAQIIASDICREPLPISPRLQRALSPARFIVRDLARGKV